jgi:hypothetical protein
MGLLDGILGAPGSDQAQAIGLLSAGLINGNFGNGLLAANQVFSPENKLRAQLGTLQLQNLQSEIDARKAQPGKLNDGLGLLSKVLGGGATYAAPQTGQLGSGTAGILPTAPGQSFYPAQTRPGGLAGATPDQIGLLKAYGFDLMEPYKIAKEGFTLNPNTFRQDPTTGQVTYTPDPTKGVNYKDGRVSSIPGYTDFLAGQTLASEAPKTLLSSAAQVNLRKNADGTESPVSSLEENPTLKNVLGSIFGQRPPVQMGPRTAPTAPAAPAVNNNPLANLPPAQPGMVGKFEGDPAAVAAAIQQMPDPQERANAQAAFESQMRANNGNLPTRYGKTTAQETQDAANAEYQKKVAGDFADQRKSIMQSDFSAPGNIAKYQKIGQLLSDVDGGKFTPAGTELASALNSFGIKVDRNLSNKQAAMALANEAALQLRSPSGGAGMPGALSNSDRDFLASMTPNQAQSADGRKQVIDAYIAVQKRNQQIGQFARNYEKKYGQLDNGFFGQLSAWSNSNPLFGGK